MNNVIEFSTPVPYCLVPGTHPAFGYRDSNNTDVSDTINRHSVYELGDDFDRVQADDWLSAIGGFK
jgi:hypothetical protein